MSKCKLYIAHLAGTSYDLSQNGNTQHMIHQREVECYVKN